MKKDWLTLLKGKWSGMRQPFFFYKPPLLKMSYSFGGSQITGNFILAPDVSFISVISVRLIIKFLQRV